MAKNIFSQVYYPNYQNKVMDAIQSGDIGEAVHTLENLPEGGTFEEKAVRIRCLVEGYRAIVGLRDIVEKGKTVRDYKEIKELLDRRDISGADDLEIMLDELDRYEEIGEPEQLLEMKDKMTNYERGLSVIRDL